MKYTWQCSCCDGDRLTVERSMSKYDRKPLKRERNPWCEGRGWERVLDAPAIKNGDGFKASPMPVNKNKTITMKVTKVNRKKKILTVEFDTEES